MSDTIEAGDGNRLRPPDDTLPEPPEHHEDVEEADQPEPEEVRDEVLDN